VRKTLSQYEIATVQNHVGNGSPRTAAPVECKKRRQRNVIDKSVLALPEPRRIRDREHVRYVIQQSCLICGRRPSDAHHLRFAQSREGER